MWNVEQENIPGRSTQITMHRKKAKKAESDVSVWEETYFWIEGLQNARQWMFASHLTLRVSQQLTLQFAAAVFWHWLKGGRLVHFSSYPIQRSEATYDRLTTQIKMNLHQHPGPNPRPHTFNGSLSHQEVQLFTDEQLIRGKYSSMAWFRPITWKLLFKESLIDL